MNNRIRLAVADGHQQKYGFKFFQSCHVEIEGYDSKSVSRRPTSNLDEIEIKVIRPQDMTGQVALGHFDIAVTGEDWFIDHRYRFPNSPVEKVLQLPFGGVRVCAAVHNDLGVETVEQFCDLFRAGKFPMPFIRIASEYVNIADRFAYSRHFPRYTVIPTSGSTEAYLPEDADMIIENSQTGRTLIENNLGVIDVLFKSSACVIANSESMKNEEKKKHITDFLTKCRIGLEKEENGES